MAIIIGLQKQFYNWVTKTKLLWLQKHKESQRESVTKTQRERLGYKNKIVRVTKTVTKTQRDSERVGYKNAQR